MRRQLLIAFFPIVLFWGVEHFYGLKQALLVGMIAATIEIGWEWLKTRKVSFMTWTSNGLVLILGAISFVMDSGIAFKLQPMIMELAMAAVMLGLRFRGGEPFMIRTFRSAPVLDEQKRKAALAQSWFSGKLKRADSRLLIFLTFHGLLVGWAAVWASTDTWGLVTKPLFYVLLVLVMLPMYKRPDAKQSGKA